MAVPAPKRTPAMTTATVEMTGTFVSNHSSLPMTHDAASANTPSAGAAPTMNAMARRETAEYRISKDPLIPDMAIWNFSDTVRLDSIASAILENPSSPRSVKALITRMPRTSKTLTSASLASMASRASLLMPPRRSANTPAICDSGRSVPVLSTRSPIEIPSVASAFFASSAGESSFTRNVLIPVPASSPLIP